MIGTLRRTCRRCRRVRRDGVGFIWGDGRGGRRAWVARESIWQAVPWTHTHGGQRKASLHEGRGQHRSPAIDIARPALAIPPTSRPPDTVWSSEQQARRRRVHASPSPQRDYVPVGRRGVPVMDVEPGHAPRPKSKENHRQTNTDNSRATTQETAGLVPPARGTAEVHLQSSLDVWTPQKASQPPKCVAATPLTPIPLPSLSPPSPSHQSLDPRHLTLLFPPSAQCRCVQCNPPPLSPPTYHSPRVCHGRFV